ncbi:hypothetical protein BJ978_002482 [Agromyces terreus]|uniref:DUF1643 domain-containing protein n=1 Tax=Agromyces terreus TaxID=424795 RepID=A0A9X2H233_9MICO|nr:DUF1643 domain-containing protein [Agromyces terreus]MCP2371806.1 hypothetical protein [Agromyces terreus]
MIEYPKGHEPDFWSPTLEVQSHRFALGNTARASAGDPPLIAICMNPSYAMSSEADKTVNRLIQASIDNGHPGWVMLNLYPERATNSAHLTAYDAELSAANCAAIERVLRQYRVSEVLGAWGQLRHRTLRRAKKDVLDLLERLGVGLFTFDGLTASSDPRHPMPRGKPLLMTGDQRFLNWTDHRLTEVVP